MHSVISVYNGIPVKFNNKNKRKHSKHAWET